MKVVWGLVVLAILMLFIGGIGKMSMMADSEINKDLGDMLKRPTFQEANNNYLGYLIDNVVYGAKTFVAIGKIALTTPDIFVGGWSIVYFIVFIGVGAGVIVFLYGLARNGSG